MRELVEGWRNYRLIHRLPAKRRVSFRLSWHPTERRFAASRDHIYLFKHDPALIDWARMFVLKGPDEFAMHTDMPGRLEACERIADPASRLESGHTSKPL